MSPIPKPTVQDQNPLLNWYLKEKRNLPWRKNTDFYPVWISEIMLQQTTVQAVIPYFNKFLDRFPGLLELAEASIEEVNQYWSGLGYYSRARNLHRAAKQFVKEGVPTTYEKLLDYPGLGPYTARSVASIAFNEEVGVLDGNVIRILCRRWGLAWEHWKMGPKKQLQQMADQMVKQVSPADMNQAMMELGAKICTPQNPKCEECPWQKDCKSKENSLQEKLPLKKTPAKKVMIKWTAHLIKQDNKWAVTKKHPAPFLKNRWFLPGEIEEINSTPSAYLFTHHITKYIIYVLVKCFEETPKKGYTYMSKEELNKQNPSSLIKKTLDHFKV